MVARRKSWRFYENRHSAEKAHAAHTREPYTSGMLGHLGVPVLVGCGRQDMNLPEAERIAASIPGSELHIMEMTGHGSPVFRPGLFSKIVIDFARDRLVDS